MPPNFYFCNVTGYVRFQVFMASSGMLRGVALVTTDLSEELSA
jgi:hypothetical protein